MFDAGLEYCGVMLMLMLSNHTKLGGVTTLISTNSDLLKFGTT